MIAQVMISSVTKDEIPLGDIGGLGDLWRRGSSLGERLKARGIGGKSKAQLVPFPIVVAEVLEHLKNRYGFEVYRFDLTAGEGRPPEEETLRKVRESHLVIGIIGSRTGWTVGDHDPLTPTLRELRVAMQRPLTLRLFVLRGSAALSDATGELAELLKALGDYKHGNVYQEFDSAADLFARIEMALRDHINRATVRFALDIASREPTTEGERWLLAPYRTRVKMMQETLESVAASLGIAGELVLGKRPQPVLLHCTPDSFSVAESKKFAAYIFDDEIEKGAGSLHLIAIFGSVTDLQIRKHIGNFEAAEVYRASWGFYGAEQNSGIQALYLPRCINRLAMQARLSEAITWLETRAGQVAALSERRRRISGLLVEPDLGAKKTRPGKTGSVTSG